MDGNDALKSLHTAIVDARQGYDEALSDATDTSVRSRLSDMSAFHRTAHDAIHRMLEARGETADDSGSLMATVHRTVIAVRSAVTGLDRSSLRAFASGEERIISDYDEAVAESAEFPQDKAKLISLRDALRARIEQLKTDAA